MSAATWACGDCGTEYPMTVDYCQRDGLDAVIVTRFGDDAPVYTATADALNVNPVPDWFYLRAWGSQHPVPRLRYGGAA